MSANKQIFKHAAFQKTTAPLNCLPIKQSAYLIQQYPISIAGVFLWIGCAIWFLGSWWIARARMNKQYSDLLFSIEGSAHLGKVPLWLIGALMSGGASDLTHFNRSIAEAHFVVSYGLTDVALHPYLTRIPDSFYHLVGRTVAYSLTSLSARDVIPVVERFDEMCTEFQLGSYYSIFFGIENFLTNAVLLLFMLGIHLILWDKIVPYCVGERLIPDILLKKIDSWSSDASPTFEQVGMEEGQDDRQTPHLRKKDVPVLKTDALPLLLFVIDPDLKVLYRSEKAGSFKIELMQCLSSDAAELDPESRELGLATVNEIKVRVKEFQRKHSASSTWVPLGKKQSLMLTPYYEYRGTLTLVHVTCIECDMDPSESALIMSRAASGYYQPLNTQLPRYTKRDLQGGKTSVCCFLFFTGFGVWADETDEIQKVQKGRQALSVECEAAALKVDPSSVCAEWPDGLCALFASKSLHSRLTDLSSMFGEEALRIAEKIKEHYNMDALRPIVLVYTLKEGLFEIARRNAFTDFRNETSLTLEGCVWACKPWTVNFPAIKKEFKVSNTTKAKTVTHPNGMVYDLWLVV
jgi:hypothetical protein